MHFLWTIRLIKMELEKCSNGYFLVKTVIYCNKKVQKNYDAYITTVFFLFFIQQYILGMLPSFIVDFGEKLNINLFQVLTFILVIYFWYPSLFPFAIYAKYRWQLCWWQWQPWQWTATTILNNSDDNDDDINNNDK